MMSLKVMLIALLLASSAALAQKPDLSEANVARSLNELSGEMLECAVFFAISSQCVKGHPDPSAPKTVESTLEAFVEMLDMAIDTGRKVGLSQAAITARQKMVTDAMMKSMGGNCINIAVVIERHADFCGQLHRDADPRLQELLAGQTCTRKYRCGL
jgi:hypothetical protein